VYPEILLVRRGAPLPGGYAPVVARGEWALAVSGHVQAASANGSEALVLGDPILRNGDAGEVAARFLDAAEHGSADGFLRDRLLGNFVLCHADAERIRLYSSAAGLHHLFYDPAVGASTSLVSLASVGAQEFDPVMVYQYLSAGYTLGSRTVLGGVFRLLGGEAIRTEGSRLARERWYPLVFPDQTLSVSDLTKHLGACFQECRPTLAASATLCADVTGGFDTRLVVAMLSHLGLPFRGWVSGAKDDADVRLAMQLGDRLGFPVRQVDVKAMPDAAAAFGLEHFDRQAFLKPFQAWLDMMFANLQCPECDGLRISGHGGEQFRDFPWQQEFPFYGLRRNPNFDLQIRLRFLATHVDTGFMKAEVGRIVRTEGHRRVRDDMRAFVEETAPPDNLSACIALYLVFREGARVGGSASEKRRFFPNWAPFLEPELWLRSGRTSWFSRLGAGLSLELAEHFAPALQGLPTAAMGERARGAAAMAQTAEHYARRAAAKLLQKMRNRPYATGRAKSLPVLEGLLRTPRFQELVLAAVEPCHLDAARVETALRDPGLPGHAELLGALVPLGQLAKSRQGRL